MRIIVIFSSLHFLFFSKSFFFTFVLLLKALYKIPLSFLDSYYPSFVKTLGLLYTGTGQNPAISPELSYEDNIAPGKVALIIADFHSLRAVE